MKKSFILGAAGLFAAAFISVFLLQSNPIHSKSAWQHVSDRNFRYLEFVENSHFARSGHPVLAYRTLDGKVSDISYKNYMLNSVVKCYLHKTLDKLNAESVIADNQTKGAIPCDGELWPSKKTWWQKELDQAKG